MHNKNEKRNKKGSLSLIKLFIIINCLCYNLELFTHISILISYIKKQNEIEKIENYFKFCNDYKLKPLKSFNKVKNPKISIVVPIFNRERYIRRFLRCIQHQNFDDLEIIFIDDNSVDNGIDMLEEYRNIDKRIILLKNNKNRGTFVSRNMGVLKARGKYVILADPDDILYKNILSLCYNFAEKYDFDMLRFTMYTGTDKNPTNDYINGLESRPIYQPELGTHMFYVKNELLMTDVFINNKFVKKEIYVKALNSFNAFYLSTYMIFLEDQIMNFILYRTANSYYFLNKIGYYYVKNSMSITNNIFKMSELRMHFIFIFLKFIFENSKNTKYERDMANMLFTNLNRGFNVGSKLNGYQGDFTFYNDIVNMYLNSTYITDENKYMLEEFRSIIDRRNKSNAIAAAKLNKNITKEKEEATKLNNNITKGIDVDDKLNKNITKKKYKKY